MKQGYLCEWTDGKHHDHRSGVFRGQKFNVYREEQPGDPAFLKYMKSSLIKVGEVEITSLMARWPLEELLQDPYLRIRAEILEQAWGCVVWHFRDRLQPTRS